MGNFVRVFWLLLLSAMSVSLAIAGEGEEKMPTWFPMLEMGGVILGVIVSTIAVKIYMGMRGGMIGQGFGRILLGIISITLGIAANGMNEIVGMLSEFGAELTFELFIYAGLIFIGAGVMKVAEVAA